MIDFGDPVNNKRKGSSKTKKPQSPIERYREGSVKTLGKLIASKNKIKSPEEQTAAYKKFVNEYLDAFERFFKEIAIKLYIIEFALPRMDELVESNDVIPEDPIDAYLDMIDYAQFKVWLKTYQDLQPINLYMSQMLGLTVPFFREVEKHCIMLDVFEKWFGVKIESDTFVLKKYFPRWRGNVSKLFRLRDDYTIHNRASFSINFDKLIELFINADVFIFAAVNYIAKKLMEKTQIIDKRTLKGVPDSLPDPLAQMAEKYLIDKKKLASHPEIEIRVTKRQGKYYISEWRTDEQSFSGEPIEFLIARISRVPGKKDMWQIAQMMNDMKWHNLGEEYQGSFEHCLELIIKDPDGYFWSSES